MSTLPAVTAWEAEAARVLADGFDGCDFMVGGVEFAVETIEGKELKDDHLLLTHPSGRQVTVRVDVTVIDGLDVVQELAARPVRDLQLPTGGAA